MPGIQIYNSLSRRKEQLPKPRRGGPLRLFVCGPTTYDDAHIGHARTYIFFDFFAKYLRSRGHEVRYVQNITNVDDKIIKRAKEEKKDPLKLATFFTKRYLDDMRRIGVDAVNTYAPATAFIPQIIKQIRTLTKREYAYEIPGDGWYFDVAKFKDYGKLSGRTKKGAEDAVSRIDESVGKRNKGDFCLWKQLLRTGADLRLLADADRRRQKGYIVISGEPAWNTPLGWGRPGWHIEDTAISEKFFGPQYELHGGGLDLKFPHHEAEIAQQEAASGKKPFVRIWMHTGMVTAGGRKMSKSLENFVTVRKFLKKHPAEVLRLAFFGCHYRSPADYSETLARNAEKASRGLEEFCAKLAMVMGSSPRRRSGFDPEPGTAKIVSSRYGKWSENFKNALSNDLNTPAALAVIHKFTGELNPQIWSLDRKSAAAAMSFLTDSLKLFGISVKFPKIPSKMRQLAKEREKFRRNKQFAKSDDLRKRIQALGYTVEDTPLGPFLWPKD